MQPQETQPNIPPQMTPDEAAASLAFATQLSQGLMPKPQEDMPIEGDKTQENAPEQEETKEMDEDTPEEKDDGKMAELELSITNKLDNIRKELKDDNKRDVDALKKLIEDALKE